MQKIVTCIGSRELPEDKGLIVDKVAEFLFKNNCKIRSGGADGTDRRFQRIYEKLKGSMEIFLPWNGFQKLYVDNKQFFLVNEELCRPYTIKYHPAPDRLSKWALKLMDRNSSQVLGLNLNEPSDLTIAYTEGGKLKGGTSQALRIAMDAGIPIVNIGNYETYEEVEEQITRILNGV